MVTEKETKTEKITIRNKQKGDFKNSLSLTGSLVSKLLFSETIVSSIEISHDHKIFFYYIQTCLKLYSSPWDKQTKFATINLLMSNILVGPNER